MKLNTLRLSSILSIVILLHACGFTLRSLQDLPRPLQHLVVTSNNVYSPARIQLQQMLREASLPHGTEYVRPYELHLLQENVAIAAASTTLTYGSQYNTVTLTYTLNYQVETPTHRIVPNSYKSIVTSTSYTISNNQMLGNTKMQAFYEQQLVHQALTLLIAQLTALSNRDLHETHTR